MADYSKKRKEHLFFIFLLGALFGFLDTGEFQIAYLFGSGIGVMLFSVPLGYIIHYIVGKISAGKVVDPENDILDADLEPNEQKILKERLRYQLRPYKYGIYVALVWVLMFVVSEVMRYMR